MKLYGVGVGPGDSELLTLKAVRVLNKVKAIFVASSSKNDYSLALEVVKNHLNDNAEIIPLPFPMTKDEEVLKKAWVGNGEVVLEGLRRFNEVAFVTLGDPLLYSTFGYLAKTVKKMAPEVEIEVVPGITAAQAASSRMGIILAQGDENLVFMSGCSDGELLRFLLGRKGVNIVLYKVYREHKEIMEELERSGRLNEAKAISFCGFPQEKVYHDPKELLSSRPPYFTLMVIGGHPISSE